VSASALPAETPTVATAAAIRPLLKEGASLEEGASLDVILNGLDCPGFERLRPCPLGLRRRAQPGRQRIGPAVTRYQ
jgi:hypothetical protein